MNITRQPNVLEIGGRPLNALAHAGKESARHLAGSFIRYPLVTAFLCVYAGSKFSINAFYYHSGLMRAFLSPLVGLVIYSIAILLVDAITLARCGRLDDFSRSGTRWETPSRRTALLAVGVWLLWLVFILASMQRKDLISLPIDAGWLVENPAISSLAASVAQWLPFWTAAQIYQILINLLYWVVVPLLILAAQGFRRKDLTSFPRNWMAALPALLVYGLAFLANGFSPANWARLARTFLYPALPEEFFQRGWMQRAFAGYMRPGNAVLLTAVLVGALHVPSYVLEVYGGDLLGGIVGTLDVMLANLFYGYVFLRSGSLAAVVSIHALADVTGL